MRSPTLVAEEFVDLQVVVTGLSDVCWPSSPGHMGKRLLEMVAQKGGFRFFGDRLCVAGKGGRIFLIERILLDPSAVCSQPYLGPPRWYVTCPSHPHI